MNKVLELLNKLKQKALALVEKVKSLLGLNKPKVEVLPKNMDSVLKNYSYSILAVVDKGLKSPKKKSKSKPKKPKKSNSKKK